MVAIKSKKVSVSSGRVDPRNLWYVSDRRIRTASAAREAIEVAETAARLVRAETSPDEQRLFQALHTCAFQARRLAKEPKGEAARETWCQRWERIRGYIVEKNLGLVYSIIGPF